MRIGVVVRTQNKLWSITRFLKPETAATFAKLVEAELGDQILDINFVFLDPGHPKAPPAEWEAQYHRIKHDRMYWCPWCRAERHFVVIPPFEDSLGCEICHISDHDQHVRQYNKLNDYGDGHHRAIKKKKGEK